MKQSNKLSLKSVILAQPMSFIVPVLLGAIASLAAVVLLGLSGWFISAAGLATALGLALVFNYLTPGAIVRLMAILRTAGRYGEQVTAHNHLLGLLRTLRLWVWEQRVKRASADQSLQAKGDLLQRLVSDLDLIIRWPLAVFLPWLYASLAYLGVMVFASLIDPILIWPLLCGAFCHLIALPYIAGRQARRAVHIGQILGTHRRSRFISFFSALVTLTIRGHWQDYGARLKVLDTRQQKMEARIQKATISGRLAAYIVTIGLLFSCFYLLSVWQDGRFYLNEGVQGPWVVGFILSILAVNELVLPLIQCFVAQGQSQVGIKRLNQLCQDHELEDQPLSSKVETIELHQWRGFHGATALGNEPLTMQIKSGDCWWLKGTSGAGKSTFLAALAGDCLSQGEALLNGQPIDFYQHQGARQVISYLPQSPYVFQQSIGANLLLGNSQATEEELWAVLEAVALADWVKTLPNGLNTLLAPQGRDLSGGQCRRLVLARLLLRKAPVLLLDEPFDGLDKETIAHLSHHLLGDFKPDILLLVSHVSSPLGEQAKILTL